MNQGRRNQIVEILNKNNTVSNAELMETFGISIETVRRDLQYLEQRGLLERVYGGAIRRKFLNVEPEYLNREQENADEKALIAAAAERFISNGDTVFFDLGTTVQQLTKIINANKRITAFTNSLRSAITLSDKGEQVILPGGELRSGEYAISGNISEDYMKDFNVDKAFIGVGGINDRGVTDFILSEARLRSKIIKNASKVIALADYSKFGVRAMCKVCAVEDIDVLITDDKAPTEMINEFEKKGVQIIIAKE